MNHEDIKVITGYSGTWNWHILAVMFLNTTLIAFMLKQYPYGIATAGIMGICEYMALKRKQELQNG